MKFNRTYFFVLIPFIFLIFCNKKDQDLTGKWFIKNKFYKATYEISKEKGNLKGKVISYYDGTTKFDKSNRRDWYVFKKLIKSDDHYIDGYSGASNTNKKTISLQQIHIDTLEVKFFFSEENFRKEKWIKKN